MLLLSSGCRRAAFEEPDWENIELALNLSLHLEGWALRDDSTFRSYTREIKKLARRGERHGARFTFEANDIIAASVEQGDDTLAELVDLEHAVEVHADLWGRLEGGGYEQAVSELRADRGGLSALGIDARHVSGACAELDWLEAASRAGFTSIGGLVAWCAKSLDADLQPPELSDCEQPDDCHQPFLNFPDRLRPWRAGSSARWTEVDPDGSVIMIPAATSLGCNQESAADPSATDCEFTEEDLPLFFADLEHALDIAEPGGLEVFSVTWSMGGTLERDVLEQWFDRLQPYLDDGRVAWATTGHIKDRFEALEEREAREAR